MEALVMQIHLGDTSAATAAKLEAVTEIHQQKRAEAAAEALRKQRNM